MTTKAFSFNLLLLWHGLLAGGYTVAYLTAEEGRALHEFTGYLVLALLASRLLAAAAVAERHPWALPWPSKALWHSFRRKVMAGDLSVFRQRTPLMPLSGLVILATLILVSLSGLIAGWWGWEHLHEGIAEVSPALILLHVALVSLASVLKKVNGRGLQSQVAEGREGNT